MGREENAMLMNSNEYLHIVESIKQEIRTAQYRAAVSVNRELLILYHSIGEVINAHKTWGSKFVENLAADIKLSFPDATGYSVRNLKYMAKFALRFPDKEIVQAALAQITWYHHIALMDMFSGEEPVAAKKKATKIVKKLNANNKSHSRHFTVDFCKELGLNITELESDQTLQELVLSVHHAFIITIDATAATKLIENQNGARYITSQKK